MVGLLLKRGATGPLPLSSALSMGCEECFDVMLERAQPSDLNGALRGATVTGNLRMVNLLLGRGAKAPPTILQAAALSPTPIPADTIRAFLNSGANPNLKTSFGLTTLDFARRQGKNDLVKTPGGSRDSGRKPCFAQSTAEACWVDSCGRGEGDSSVAAVRCCIPGASRLCLLPQQLSHGDDRG